MTVFKFISSLSQIVIRPETIYFYVYEWRLFASLFSGIYVDYVVKVFDRSHNSCTLFVWWLCGCPSVIHADMYVITNFLTTYPSLPLTHSLTHFPTYYVLIHTFAYLINELQTIYSYCCCFIVSLSYFYLIYAFLFHAD